MPVPASASILAPHQQPLWRGQLLVVGCVLVLSLVGIYSRPAGYLASFWPANAVLLGLLVRYPRWGRRPSTWVLAYLAYVLADVVTGASPLWSLGFALANEVGVFGGWWFLVRRPRAVLELRQSRAILDILIGCGLAGGVSTLLGGPLGHYFFGLSWAQAYISWMVTEFAAFILLIPVFLAAPRPYAWRWRLWLPGKAMDAYHVLPILSLVLSETIALTVGGPGSLGFSVPAMVWCAMAYGVRPTVLLNLVVCLWKTVSISLGAFGFGLGHVAEITSLRLGIALLSLAPLTVACTYALRQQALQQLRQWVDHDMLTGAWSRRTLLERGTKLLARMRDEGQPMAVLMLDLDHFKSINDQYGHANGDRVLQQFVQLAQRLLRPEDMLGRMGGEEFAVLLPRTGAEQARQVARRLCTQLARQPMELELGACIRVSCSIGVAAITAWDSANALEKHLGWADQALYQAKAAGRDQVQVYVGDA